MIYYNQNQIENIHRDNKIISAVYRGARLVWELIKSCFGKGYWINSAPYVNSDGWKNKQQ